MDIPENNTNTNGGAGDSSSQLPCSIIDKLRNILADQFGRPSLVVTEQTNPVEDLGADSLDEVELIMAIEEDFDVDIDDGDAEHIKTVGDMVNYLSNERSSAPRKG